MKKTTFAYLLAAATCYFIISSYSGGAGTNGWDCTGAETGLSNPAGCKTCHGSSAIPSINVAIELDSAGIPTTNYKGGMNYTVKLTGTNNSTLTLPKFGFQMGSIKGSAAVTTPVNAGTWASPFPASTHFASPQAGNFVVGVVEQTAAIAATTGTGGNGSTYSKTFNWTAPSAGTGTISIWAVINAVNGNATDDTGDKWNTNHIVINEWPASTSIASLKENLSDITIFPNPSSGIFFLNSEITKGEIFVYNIEGEKVYSIQLTQSTQLTINLSDKPNGIYFLQVKTG